MTKERSGGFGFGPKPKRSESGVVSSEDEATTLQQLKKLLEEARLAQENGDSGVEKDTNLGLIDQLFNEIGQDGAGMEHLGHILREGGDLGEPHELYVVTDDLDWLLAPKTPGEHRTIGFETPPVESDS